MASNQMKKAVRLMVETSLTQQEIADIVGVRRETVSKYKNHEEFDELKLEAERDFLGDLVSPALREMRELLKAESEMVRMNVIKDILDRTGHKPIEKSEVEMNADVDVGKQSDVFEKYLKDVDENDGS